MRSPGPAGGDWVLVAEVRGRRPVLLLAAAGREGLSWSTTDVDVAACWLRRSDAGAAARAERAARGRLRIRVLRRGRAVQLLRLARAGALVDLRAS